MTKMSNLQIAKSQVSIIVPCFNQSQYLEEALKSVFEQSHSNWECIIVNDGSIDDTEEIALRWKKKDSRFIYLKKNNEGLSAARNSGIIFSKSRYIMPLDADDILGKNYIKLALQEFDSDKNLKVVYSKGLKFGTEQGLLSLTPFSLRNLSRNCMIFASAMFKKEDWNRVGGYDEKMIYGWEDWEFWIAILKNGGNVKRIEEICFYYRIKEVSMLKSIDIEKADYLLDYMSVKHADFFVNYFGSFKRMEQRLEREKNEFYNKLKSEKFIVDVICKKIFGFSIFGKF